METVIPPEKVKRHIVQKYQFKVLVPDGVDEKGEESQIENGKIQRYIFNELSSTEERKKEEIPALSDIEEAKEEEQTVEPQEDNSGLSEELLKRVESLSDELVKCQMTLEKREKELESRLEEERKTVFEEGVAAGRIEGQRACEEQLASMQRQIEASVRALEESRQKFLEKVDSIEEELIETALDLAKQVIVKEITQDSQEIALRLTRLLLGEIKEASSVTLKVNPQDYDYLSESLKEEKIKIIPDSVISPGGVVVISDVGSIDGDIMHRFERIKEAVFGTGK